MVPSVAMQAGNDAAQQVVNYVSNYESVVATVQQTAANLEQRAVATLSHWESSLEQTIDQILQGLFPNAAASNSNGQSTSATPGVFQGQPSSPVNLNAFSGSESNTTATEEAVPIGEASPASGTAPSAGAFTPSQIAQAYAFNQITFNNGAIKGDGSGQTIAIVGAYNDPDITSDLQTFDSYYGVAAPPRFTVVNQTGGSTLPTATDAGWIQEMSYDVEWAHAMAPGANIVLVEANSASWSDLLTAINTAGNLPGVSVVSMSFTYGSGEYSTESDEDSTFTTPSGHNGVTFVAASGDNGSGEDEPAYPSTSPNVLAVGGTKLTINSAGDYESETGWTDGEHSSGGGISFYESQPSYQQGVVTQSTTMRTVPDVSLAATNYAIYDSFSGNGWQGFEGTSAAAPIWASLIAIADQGRTLNGEGTLDGPSQTLPAIYQMPSTNFHDITTGSNGTYSAGPGYDLVTGLGTPIANSVVASLVAFGESAATQVNLSSVFNRNEAIVTDGSTFSSSYTGIDQDGNAFSSNLLGSSFTWNGVNFNFGAANTTNGLSCLGQTVTLPQGYYSSLSFLATTAFYNEPNMTFTVHYTDGTSQTFTQSFSLWSSPQNYSGESVVKSMPYRDAYNGTEKTGTWDLYGYSFALNSSKQVESITLPTNQSNIVLFAMTLTPATTGTQVNLSSVFNRNEAIVTDGSTFNSSYTGIDQDGNAFSSNLLGSSFTWNGVNFNFGAANTTNGLSCLGQTVTLPQGYYSSLSFLATTAFYNEPNMTFTVHYTDGTSQTFTQSLSLWSSPQNYSGEAVVKSMPYRDAYNGTEKTGTWDLYGYSFALNSGKQVESITLPTNQSNIVLFAMTLN